MSLPYSSAKGVHQYPNQVQNVPGQQTELSVESTLQSITSSLESLDFNEFFKKFDMDSSVCQFMDTFSPVAFHSLLSKAAAETGPGHKPPASQAVIQAKKALDDELRKLDELFRDIEAAGLHVGTVRPSLRWLKDINQRSLDRLERSQKDQGGLSQRTRAPLVFRCPPPSPKELHHPPTQIPFYMLAWERQQRRYREAYMALMGHYRPQLDVRPAQVYTPPRRHIGFNPF